MFGRRRACILLYGCGFQSSASHGRDTRIRGKNIGMKESEGDYDHALLVYVVDDDEPFRDSLRWLLESAGYRVVTYSTAERFLHEYEPGAAACLVLDVRLPGMSGLELKRELKRVGETLPIVFITGHADERTKLEALKDGASHFLRKPFQDTQLLSLIAQAARSQYEVAALKHSRC